MRPEIKISATKSTKSHLHGTSTPQRWGLVKFVAEVSTSLLLAMIVSVLSACSATPTAARLDLSRVFPAAEAIPGWSIALEFKTYDRTNLFNLVDGQAESFFAYGFEQVAVQRYKNSDGTLLNVEVWQLATQSDAYGLFSAGRVGKLAAIGVEGDSDPGRRLAFWQDRYFASLNANQPVPDETLQAFAKAITGGLPSGGVRPALVDSLPQENLVPLSAIYFHEEMSIQMEIWLGGENILGLSQQTGGVVGKYELNGQTARLLLVEYPKASEAENGLKALQAGNPTGLLASGVNETRLAAVFGKVEMGEAEALLKEALK